MFHVPIAKREKENKKKWVNMSKKLGHWVGKEMVITFWKTFTSSSRSLNFAKTISSFSTKSCLINTTLISYNQPNHYVKLDVKFSRKNSQFLGDPQ